MSAPTGYTQIASTGEYMKDSDGSGPYVFSGTAMALKATGAGGGGGGGGAVTIADGADVTQGADADAAVAAGAAGTLSAKLRRLTADIGALILQLPVSLGVKTIAGSLSVTTASDQLGSSTSSVTSVAASATNVTLLAANAARRRIVVVNDSTSATMYMKLGATASTTSYTYKLNPGDVYESPVQPVFTGQIDAIWSAAVGSARITEL